MPKQQSRSYLLSRERDESNLVEYLKKKSVSEWYNYNFEHLEDSEDVYKVLFRVILEAARYENEIFWQFTWQRIENLKIHIRVLKEANYEVIRSAVINSENQQLLPNIMGIAKKYFDDNDYAKMLETIFKYAIYCHNKLLYGIVYNNVGCLNFLWGYVTDEEKRSVLSLADLNIQNLFGMLSVEYLLEDTVILQILKDRNNLHLEPSNKLFLSDKKIEDVLLGFLDSPNIRQPKKRLDSLWKKTFAKCTAEEQSKVLLRLFISNIKSPRNKTTEWAWEKSLELNQQIFLLNGANYSAIKHVLVDCNSSTLQEFLCKAGKHLSRIEMVEMLKEGVEHIVYWHGMVFDEAVLNNSNSLQDALKEFGESLSSEVYQSLKETTKIKHDLMLKYEGLQQTPEPWFAHHILANNQAESQFLKFLQVIKGNEQISIDSVELEWKFRGLDKLFGRDLYSALFRVFIFSVGLTEVVIMLWVFSKIENAGLQKKILKEQNYHFIKTAMDLSDVNILNRALIGAVKYLDAAEVRCMYQEAYMHAVKGHGNFIGGEVWDSTRSLETLKKMSTHNQWRSIFKFTDQKVDGEAKRHPDKDTQPSCDKRIRKI